MPRATAMARLTRTGTPAMRRVAASVFCWIASMTITSTDFELPAPALLRLLQLVSPALPIGGYNFSQGLEYAIEAGWVANEASALGWIGGLMGASVGTLDVPVLRRLHEAWSSKDIETVERWSRFLIAS